MLNKSFYFLILFRDYVIITAFRYPCVLVLLKKPIINIINANTFSSSSIFCKKGITYIIEKNDLLLIECVCVCRHTWLIGYKKKTEILIVKIDHYSG